MNMIAYTIRNQYRHDVAARFYYKFYLVVVYHAPPILKLMSAIFYQICIFSPNDSSLKTMKNLSFPHLPDSKEPIEVE